MPTSPLYETDEREERIVTAMVDAVLTVPGAPFDTRVRAFQFARSIRKMIIAMREAEHAT
jgi:hypothetical protein